MYFYFFNRNYTNSKKIILFLFSVTVNRHLRFVLPKKKKNLYANRKGIFQCKILHGRAQPRREKPNRDLSLSNSNKKPCCIKFPITENPTFGSTD